MFREIFQELKNTIVSNAHTLAEPYVPLLIESKFSETGQLTPEEFVEAGDFLCLKCPSWSWSSAKPDYEKLFLPKNKQFLITRNVPCNKNTRDCEFRMNGDLVECIDKSQKFIDSESESEESDDFLVDDSLLNIFNTNVIKTKTYDIHITYDRYYRGPKLWLYGRNENGQPLSTKEMLNDISSDQVNKTATMEIHPFNGMPYLTIHNCRHADIIKKFSQGTRPDKSLIIFLKFMSSIIPNINYDFTTSIEYHS